MKTLYESLLDDFDNLVDNINYLDKLINPNTSSRDQDDALRSLKPIIIEDGQKSLKNLKELLKAKSDQLFICFPEVPIRSFNWCMNPTIIQRISDERFYVYYSYGNGRIKRREIDMYMLRGEKIPKRNLDMYQRDADEFIKQINPPKYGEIYEFPEFLYNAWKKSKIESIIISQEK